MEKLLRWLNKRIKNCEIVIGEAEYCNDKICAAATSHEMYAFKETREKFIKIYATDAKKNKKKSSRKK